MKKNLGTHLYITSSGEFIINVVYSAIVLGETSHTIIEAGTISNESA